jgi:alkaline phosphatase D
VDTSGHGYTTVQVTSQAFETDFLCIPQPVERRDRADGGPLRYRVRHRARIWRKGKHPRLEPQVIEGDRELAAG